MYNYDGRQYQSRLDAQLIVLFKVLGGTFPPTMFENKFLAEQVFRCQKSGVTERRKSGRLRDHEPGELVMAYELNAKGLDYRLFDLDLPAFHEALEAHGVGQFGGGGKRRLARLLQARLSPELSLKLAIPTPQRGVAYAAAPQTIPMLMHANTPVIARIRARRTAAMPGCTSRHFALVQFLEGAEETMETLAPTAALPLTEMDGSSLTLPNDPRHPWCIRGPKSAYRLLAVETTEEIVQLFCGDDLDQLERDRMGGIRAASVRMTDKMAAKILTALDGKALRTAEAALIVQD
ncbi:MAG: hypothetical protein AAF909_03445 [Pseudomonadota bacterium]